MRYSVDKIENNIVVLENLETKEKVNVNKEDLSFEVLEKDVLLYKNNDYVKDEILKEDRIKMLKEKMERLRKGN